MVIVKADKAPWSRQLYARVDRWTHVRAGLSAAIVLSRARDMTLWLPQTEAALAQVEGR